MSSLIFDIIVLFSTIIGFIHLVILFQFIVEEKGGVVDIFTFCVTASNFSIYTLLYLDFRLRLGAEWDPWVEAISCWLRCRAFFEASTVAVAAGFVFGFFHVVPWFHVANIVVYHTRFSIYRNDWIPPSIRPIRNIAIDEVVAGDGRLELGVSWKNEPARLDQLPRSITGLANVTKLQLMHSRGTRLPKHIGNMQSLRVLNLFRCKRLTSLPESLGHLSNLEILNVQRCRDLEKLPASLGQLKGLKILRLTLCNIRQLPESIGGLSCLTELDFDTSTRAHRVETARLPDSMGNLTSLVSFSFHLQHMDLLPNTNVLSRWTNLRKISVVRCSDAQFLSLSEECLSKIVNSWGDHLLDVAFSFKCRLDQVPPLRDFLFNLRCVQRLSLSFANNLSRYALQSRDLVVLTNRLEHLFLDHCTPAGWRDGVVSFQSLKSLELSQSDLSNEQLSMPFVEKLSLRGNSRISLVSAAGVPIFQNLTQLIVKECHEDFVHRLLCAIPSKCLTWLTLKGVDYDNFASVEQVLSPELRIFEWDRLFERDFAFLRSLVKRFPRLGHLAPSGGLSNVRHRKSLQMLLSLNRLRTRHEEGLRRRTQNNMLESMDTFHWPLVATNTTHASRPYREVMENETSYIDVSCRLLDSKAQQANGLFYLITKMNITVGPDVDEQTNDMTDDEKDCIEGVESGGVDVAPDSFRLGTFEIDVDVP